MWSEAAASEGGGFSLFLVYKSSFYRLLTRYWIHVLSKKSDFFNPRWCEKEVWGSSLRLEMGWALSATKGMVCGWMILLQSMHSLCSSLTSCHVMGPLGEFIQCPNLSEGNLGFAGGLISSLGNWGSPQGQWQRWWEEAVARFFKTHCVLSVWSLETCGKGWCCSPSRESLASQQWSLRGREATSIMERLGNVESAQQHLE